MDKKTTSIVSYITIIGWLIAFFAGDREGAKFYLNQSLVLVLTNLALSILAKLIPGIIFGIIFWALDIVVFVFWILGLVHAIKQDNVPVPLVGKINILK